MVSGLNTPSPPFKNNVSYTLIVSHPANHRVLLIGADIMQIKKICPRCRSAIIDASETYCARCAESQQARKAARHREYDKLRRDKDATDFYHSAQWRHMVDYVRQVQGGVDVWSLYQDGRIITDDLCVHHIVEVRDDWERRLDAENLILLSRTTHRLVHGLYQVDMAGTQATLRQLLQRHYNNLQGRA